MNKKYAIDWGNNDDKFVVFDGKKVLKKLPTTDDTDVIVGENIPQKFLKQIFLNNTKVMRCSTYRTEDYRKEHDIEKTDEGDARIIFEIHKTHPSWFKEVRPDPPLKTYYALFKELQKVRVSMSNRLYANENEEAKVLFKTLEKSEAETIKIIGKELKKFGVHNDFLKDVKGLGPALSAGLIANTPDADTMPNVSKLWAYFGYHVVDGKAPKMRKGVRCNWNMKARSLCYCIADQFIKQRTPVYREIYDTEKELQVQKEGITKLHAHNRAIRKMVKVFLQHYWVAVREAKGLPTNSPYVIDIKKHSKYIAPATA